ncbi:MAG: uroporphyrinogen decarboxylase [Clostridia bacterium]|nr:uroporphyrinogen decarboxylase [Clostridia bacterium]
MNKKQRVVNSLNHIEPDRIPFEVSFTIPQWQKMAAYFGDNNFEDKINNHLKVIDYSMPHTELEYAPGHFMDQWGVVWNRSGPDKDIGIVENHVIEEPDAFGFDLPEIDFNELGSRLVRFSESNKDVFKVFNIGFSLFERAWTLRGMENLLMDMIMHPDFVHGLLDRICGFNISLVEFAASYDVDGVCFGDDWGQQRGLIMGPAMWREFIKPRLKRAYSAVRKSGKFVMQHSCGDISEVLPDVIECGLHCYQTFQPEIYDIARVKSELGNDLSFWGAISTQSMLPFETPDGVRQKTISIMKTLGPGGGYIASPTHAVPYDVPAGNIAAMLDVFENQHKYL